MYQKRKEGKDDKRINTYATIMVRTFGRQIKNCS